MKRLVFLIALLCAMPAKAQNASPLGGAPLQFFDQNGVLLSGGYIYSYTGGTSTPVTVYIDGTATTTQPNPTPLAAGARASLFYLNGTFVKIQICQSNDGPSCSPGDVLASMDMIPIGSSASSGNTGTFAGIFISSTASPATSGVLRLSSGDSVCYRNAAGSANLCFSKNSNDIISWSGGSFQLPEIAAPACGGVGADCFWADNTQHRFKTISNGGSAAQFVLSGNDIGTTDQVQALHFSATQETLSSTAPTSGQLLFFNGTNIAGVASPPELILSANGQTSLNILCGEGAGVSNLCQETVFASAHTLIRLTFNLSQAPSGCVTNAVVGVRDVTAGSNLTTITVNQGVAGFVDSGALSIATTAGHKILVGATTAAATCTTVPNATNVSAVFQ